MFPSTNYLLLSGVVRKQQSWQPNKMVQLATLPGPLCRRNLLDKCLRQKFMKYLLELCPNF